MFFQNRKLPPKIREKIEGYLSRSDRLTTRTVCQQLREDIDEFGLVWQDAGAIDRADFIKRMRALSPKLQNLVLSNNRYTLPIAENIARLMSMPVDQCVNELFTPEQIAAMPNNLSIQYLIERENNRENCIIALCEGLTTPEQIARFNPGYLMALMQDNGILLLRERLITPEQAITLFNRPGNIHLFFLTDDDSVKALRERLITIEEAAAIPAVHVQDEIGKRLSEAEAKRLRINSQMLMHWRANGCGLFRHLPNEIIANILVYSRNPDSLSSVEDAKAVIFEGMENPHPGP